MVARKPVDKTNDTEVQGTEAPTKKSPSRSLAPLLLVALLAAAIAAAGSQGGSTVSGFPVFAAIVVWIFLVQLVAFAFAWSLQSERFFDLVGSLTYVTAIVGGAVLSKHTNLSALLLAAAVTVWALRLGPFLFMRIRRAGSDDRFDEIKPDFPRFLTLWMIQGLWITVTLSAALAAVTTLNQPPVTVLTIIGISIWALGFLIEVVADLQKSRFRADPANRDRFINSGIWSWSRHPNYFGEITLWLGIAIAAFPALHGWQYITLISPVFVLILLTRISGIPLLERKADSRWGGRPDYEAYKSSTSILIPFPAKKSSR